MRVPSLALLLFLLPALALAQQQTPTAVNGGIYLATPPTLTDRQASVFHLDSAGNLQVNLPNGITGTVTANPGAGTFNVNCLSGCGGSGGTSSAFAAAFPTQGTAIGVKNGANMVNLTADGSNNLNINCVVGCAGGTFNNNADAVATSATNGQAAAWLYGFNGVTFDRLRVDASKNLNVNLSANSFGTLTVSGTVTANQGGAPWSDNITQIGGAALAFGQAAMASSIPVVIASNQSAVPASQSGSWTVTANAGTNLNTSALALDTSVNGLLLGQASTTSGQKGPLVQGAVTTNAPTYTTAQTDPLSLDTSGLLRMSLKDTPSNTNNFNVNLAASAATVTVSGTVTANAGTNLNTSALALESGGNLATVAGAVSASKMNVNLSSVAAALHLSTNIDQIGGSALAFGQAVMASSIPVVIASNQSNVNVACVSGCSGTTLGQTNMKNSLPVTLAYDQPVIPVSIQANPLAPLAVTVTNTKFAPIQVIEAGPVVVSGTVTDVQGTVPWQDNITQVGGVAISLGQAGKAQSLPVTLASDQPPFTVNVQTNPVSGTPLQVNVVNTAPVPVNIKQSATAPPRCTVTACVSGAANTTSNSAVTIIAAQPRPMWITGVQCGRTDAGTTGMIVTLNDSASTVLVLPNGGGGGGNNPVISIDSPLFVKSGTAFTFTPGTSVTTSYCNAQGYLG